jgi:hypothetical protein
VEAAVVAESEEETLTAADRTIKYVSGGYGDSSY